MVEYLCNRDIERSQEIGMVVMGDVGRVLDMVR
jgi:hypothetical protein